MAEWNTALSKRRIDSNSMAVSKMEFRRPKTTAPPLESKKQAIWNVMNSLRLRSVFCFSSEILIKRNIICNTVTSTTGQDNTLARPSRSQITNALAEHRVCFTWRLYISKKTMVYGMCDNRKYAVQSRREEGGQIL